jgi:branched-chain amino acid transport system permease protein
MTTPDVAAPAPAASIDLGVARVRVTRSRRPHPIIGVAVEAVTLGLAAAPAVVGPGTTATLVDLYALLAMATMWNLLAGYAGLVSIGQQAFIGLGAYGVLVLAQWGMQPFLALPLAAAGAAIAAVPISWLLFRLRGGYFAIATWVVADALSIAISRVPSLGGGTGAALPGVDGIAPVTRLAWTYWAALAVVVVALGATYWLLRGRLGLVLTAIRDDETGARSLGANVGAAKRWVFLIAAAGCGAAGGLLALSQLNVQAASVFSVGWSAKLIFIVIIGGMGSIEGPILGTLVFFGLQELLSDFGAWYFIASGAVAIAVALWAPRGLWGVIADRTHLRPFPVGYWLWGAPERTAEARSEEVATP